MEDKITIIEGPPPVFEPVQDGFALGLGEGPKLPLTLLTRLRTYNGPALVERCYRRWHANQPIHLEYRNDLGLAEQALVMLLRETAKGLGISGAGLLQEFGKIRRLRVLNRNDHLSINPLRE